ncbi:hypothetical protein CR152_01740 [Massilia violaceinigra]|uniref:DUF1795 domain-containing protein n=2 Tax=Massilia violaceinigra TaxID=2045208 RepID=A0A2D2DEH3_9BURK|nr:hypothetical protein CR152_01740 [Massilia violaceinigra]
MAQATTYEPSIGVSFPSEIAGMTLQGRTAFPQKALGVAIEYTGSDRGMRGALYIYNGGLASVPADIDAPVVRKHFEQVVADLKAWEGTGKVRMTQAVGKAERTTTFAGCGPQFIVREFEIDLPEGTLASASYLTTMKNNFVKLRVSYMKSAVQGPQAAQKFVQQVRQLLGGCQ